MSDVDFGFIKNEVENASFVYVMQALVRKSIYHHIGNHPVILIATDEAIYLGGTKGYGGRFRRISKKSIESLLKRGVFLWECVEVKYFGLGGVESLFICPFSGSEIAPKKDRELFDVLLSIFRP
jgi:hypothetical protein